MSESKPFVAFGSGYSGSYDTLEEAEMVAFMNLDGDTYLRITHPALPAVAKQLAALDPAMDYVVVEQGRWERVRNAARGYGCYDNDLRAGDTDAEEEPAWPVKS